MRIKYIDSLKGFAILLVIIGHICPAGIWRSLIYSFHMALFFFLSGLFGNCNINSTRFLLKKSKTLLLPFACFIILHSFFFNLSIKDIFYDNVKDGLWFILVLFIIQLIDFLCFKISIKKGKLFYFFSNIIIILLLIVAKLYLPTELSTLFSLSYLSTNYPFYLLGRLFKEQENIRVLLFQSPLKEINSIILFLAITSFTIIWRESFYYNQSNEFSNMYLRLSGTISLFLIFRHFYKSKYLSLFSFLGKETLAIYLLHVFFIERITNDIQYLNITSPFIQLLIYLISSYIIAIACLITAKVIKSNKYLGLLLGIKN